MKWFSGVDDGKRLDAMGLLCQVLYERGHEALPPVGTEAEMVLALSAFIPAFSEKKGIPHEVMVTVDEVIACFGVRPGGAQTKSGDVMVVETQDAREAKEKFLRIAGRRFVRHPVEPWNVFYLHPWLAKMESGQTIAVVTEAWLRTIKEAFATLHISEVFVPRQKHLHQCFVNWFLMLPVPCPTAEKLPDPFVLQFGHLAEQLLELMVLSTRLEGTMTTATTTLELELQAQYHSGNIDYFACYKAVITKEKVKSESKNDAPRGGRGRGGGK